MSPENKALAIQQANDTIRMIGSNIEAHRKAKEGYARSIELFRAHITEAEERMMASDVQIQRDQHDKARYESLIADLEALVQS